MIKLKRSTKDDYKVIFFENMEKYSIEEIEKIIEKELRKGKSYEEIAQLIGRNKTYVWKTKKELVQKGIITDNEIENAKFTRTKNFMLTDPRMQKIMEYVKAGLSQTDIAQLVGYTQTVVGYHIRRFIQYGLITREEVDKARREYMQEVKYDNFRRDDVLEQLMQGRLKNHFASELGITAEGARVIQNSLIEEGRITQAEIDEAVATKGEEVQRRNKAIELLRQGYMYKEVAEEVGYCPQTVKKIKDEAIAEGKLTEEEYQNARKQRRERLKNEPYQPKKEDKQLEEQILELLKKGKSMYFIRKKTGEIRANIQVIIKKLIEDKKISQSEIDNARDKANKELERKVLIGLRRGYSHREIVEMFEKGEYSLGAIQSCILVLKEKGKITDEEIERYKYEAEQGEKQLHEFVLRGIKNGLSRVAMAQLDETGYFTESKIKYAIKKMKEQGIITDKELGQGRRVRKKSNQQQVRKARNKIDKEIIKLLLQGFTAKEIGNILGYAERTIWEYTIRIKNEGKITEEEIKNARKQRRKEVKEKNKQEAKENARKQKEENENLYSEYKRHLEIAKKVYGAKVEYKSKKINDLVQNLIIEAAKMQNQGKMQKEELKIIMKALFEAEKIDVNNVLGLARLYISIKDYQGAIYLLNQSKQLLDDKEDLSKLDKAVQTITLYRRKIEARQMLQQGYSIEIISQRTKLNASEIMELNRKLKEKKENSVIEEQAEDEFPDL